jgi:hypothetical protein
VVDGKVHKREQTMTVQAMFAVEGMTLRDWFAGQALAARVAKPDTQSTEAQNPAELAKWAYAVAQAMLAQREQLYSDEEQAMWGPLFGHPPPGGGDKAK